MRVTTKPAPSHTRTENPGAGVARSLVVTYADADDRWHGQWDLLRYQERSLIL